MKLVHFLFNCSLFETMIEVQNIFCLENSLINRPRSLLQNSREENSKEDEILWNNLRSNSFPVGMKSKNWNVLKC